MTRSFRFIAVTGSLCAVALLRTINFTNGINADDQDDPDFDTDDGSLVLEWDNDIDGPIGGNDVEDDDVAATTMAVPQDYVSDPTLAIAASKETNTLVGVRLRCNTTIAGAATTLVNAPLTTGGVSTYLFPLNGTYFKGVAVTVRCQVDDGGGGPNHFDIVQVRSVEFRYTASQ